MSLVTPDEGQIELLENMVIAPLVTTNSYHLDLYQNDYTPAQDSTASDFTICTFTGYEQFTIERSDWETPITVADQAKTVSVDNPYEWTNGGTAQTVYGYLVRSVNTGVVLWAELIDPSRNLGTGDTFQLSLEFLLYTAPSGGFAVRATATSNVKKPDPSAAT